MGIKSYVSSKVSAAKSAVKSVVSKVTGGSSTTTSSKSSYTPTIGQSRVVGFSQPGFSSGGGSASSGSPTSTSTSRSSGGGGGGSSSAQSVVSSGPTSLSDLDKTSSANKLQEGTLTSRKTSPTVGVLLTTPEETKSLAARGIISYDVGSGTSAKDLVTATNRAAYTSNTPYYGTEKSKGVQQANLISITQTKDVISAVESFKENPANFSLPGTEVTTTDTGYSLTFQDSFFKASETKARTEYDKAYSDLSFGTKTQLQLGEAGLRATQLGVSTAEMGLSGITNLGSGFGGGMPTSVSDYKPFSIKTTQFAQGTFLGDIAAKPVLTTGVSFKDQPFTAAYERAKLGFTNPGVGAVDVGQVGLLLGGARSFQLAAQSQGAKVAVAEAAGIFSPIRLKSGIYGPKIDSNTKFNVGSLKQGNVRVYYGENALGDIKLTGVERFTSQGKGAGLFEVSSPYIEIKGAGAFVDMGTRTVTSKYAFQPISQYQDSQFTKGAFEQFSKVTSDISVSSKGVKVNDITGVSTRTVIGGKTFSPNEVVSLSTSGKGSPVYKTTRLDRGFLYQPEGYTYSPNIKTVELNLGGIDTGRGFTSTGGGGLVTSTKSVGTFTPSVTIPKPTTLTGTKIAPIVKITEQTSSGRFAPTVTIPKPTNIQTTSTIPQQMPKLGQIQIPRTRTGTSTKIIPARSIIPALDQRQRPLLKMPIISPTFQTPVTTTKFPSIIPPRGFGFGGGFTPSPYIPILPIPSLPPMPFAGSILGKVYKGKVPRQYTPSLGAILTGYKAPKITGGVKFAELTGFQARPIITGRKKKTKTSKKNR